MSVVWKAKTLFAFAEARALSSSPHNQDSRDSLVVVDFSVEINSEQNRLSPPPLTVNDASEGFSFLW